METPLPERMAQYHDRLSPWLVFFRKKASSYSRANPEHREEVPGHTDSVDALRLASAAEVKLSKTTVSGYALEYLALLTPIEKIGAGHQGVIEARPVFCDPYQTAWVAIRPDLYPYLRLDTGGE